MKKVNQDSALLGEILANTMKDGEGIVQLVAEMAPRQAYEKTGEIDIRMAIGGDRDLIVEALANTIASDKGSEVRELFNEAMRRARELRGAAAEQKVFDEAMRKETENQDKADDCTCAACRLRRMLQATGMEGRMFRKN